MRTRPFLLALTLLAAVPVTARGQNLPKFPGRGDDNFNFGPTGASGMPLEKSEAEAAGLGKFLGLRVEKVAPGTAAHGHLQPGDVIFLAGGKPFPQRQDAVLAFSRAVEDAEAARSPVLKVKVMRGGRPTDVSFKVAPLGRHSRTCPAKCEKCATVLHRALVALKGMQAGDGSFPTKMGNLNGKVVVTTLSGLAFVASGSTPGKGPFGPEVNKAVAYLLRHAGKEMKFGNMGGKGNWSQLNWNVGYAPLLLAEAYQATGDQRVLAKIDELAKAICRNQEASGGWAHGPGGPNALNYLELEIVSNYCMASLGIARQLGLEVPQEVIDRSVRWIEQTGAGDGGVGYSPRPGQKGFGDAGRTAGAMLAFDACGLSHHPFRPKMAAYFKRNGDKLISGHVSPCMHMLAGALASAKLGDAAWRKYWSVYRDVIMSARCADGSFSARPTRETQALHNNSDRGMGKAWITAHFALILAAKKSKLAYWGK